MPADFEVGSNWKVTHFMKPHIFSIGDHAPEILNAVIEIPRTRGMTKKLEVDLTNGDVVCTGRVIPPIPTYWHYGAIPETLGDEGEALDVLIFEPFSHRRSFRDQIQIRPIGMLEVADGWEIRDDKIIAVPYTPAYDHIRNLDDLPAITLTKGTQTSFSEAVEHFFKTYRPELPLYITDWRGVEAALKVISEGQHKYRCLPLARDSDCDHIYPQYLHVFLPPPPKHFGPTRYVEDILPVRQLFEAQDKHPEYGYVVSGRMLKEAIRAAGHEISRSRLIGHDRERLIEERLRMAELMMHYGAKVFTASNDHGWLDRATELGVIGNLVDHESYEVENVAGISVQDLKVIQFQRSDGTRVVIAESGTDKHTIADRLQRIGVAGRNDPCEVLNVPDRLIPWEVPSRGTKRMTQLTNWIDYGFNVWPDRNNRPHLVVGEALLKIAKFQQRQDELQSFFDRSCRFFESIHILELADEMPFGCPTNSIDVGTAILSNSSLSNKSRDAMQQVLKRPIDNSLHVDEDAPGLRCAIVPIDRTVYSLLLEGDPLYHASVDRQAIDPLDPHDAFFDVYEIEHENLTARVRAKRQELLAHNPSLDSRVLKRHRPVRG